jgi:hypothetical protein
VIWQGIANEDRKRQAVDNPQAQRSVVNEGLEKQLLEWFHSADYTAPHSVNLASYSTSVQVDPSKPPAEPKTLVWFREQRRYIRVLTACILTGFVHKTGNGEMGADGADADGRFFKYCRGDMLIMFMWLHWQRGERIPAHCNALLDSDNVVDIGAGATVSARGSAPAPSHVNSRTVNSEVHETLQTLKQVTAPLLQLTQFLSPAKGGSATMSSASSTLTSAVHPSQAQASWSASCTAEWAARLQAWDAVKKLAEGDDILTHHHAASTLS